VYPASKVEFLGFPLGRVTSCLATQRKGGSPVENPAATESGKNQKNLGGGNARKVKSNPWEARFL
jgi:hypothetical protein